jgi:serine/threonine protein kinase
VTFNIVTEKADLGTLSELLVQSSQLEQQKDSGAISFIEKIGICLEIAKTLHFLHQSELKVFHRDIKADNILISSIAYRVPSGLTPQKEALRRASPLS